MKVLVEVVDIRKSKVDGLTDVVLLHQESNTVICISMGTYEADLIALAKEDSLLAFPVSYDFTVAITEAFGIDAEYFIIDSFKEGVYGAKVYLNSEGKRFVFDVRVSDGINFALRKECPIYVTEELLKEVGFEADALSLNICEKPNAEAEEEFSIWDLDMLEAMLDEAVANEDYDLAAMIRDQIKDMK